MMIDKIYIIKSIQSVLEMYKVGENAIKLVFTQDLEKKGEIDVQQILPFDNLADLLTKALPTSSFQKLVFKIEIHRLQEIK